MRLRCVASSLLVSLLLLPSIASAQTTGRSWMQLPEGERALYVLGCFEGTQALMRTAGFEYRSLEAMSAADVSAIVYRKLLAEPELRSGPMPDIIGNALAPYVVLTDPQGRRIRTSGDGKSLAEQFKQWAEGLGGGSTGNDRGDK